EIRFEPVAFCEWLQECRGGTGERRIRTERVGRDGRQLGGNKQPPVRSEPLRDGLAQADVRIRRPRADELHSGTTCAPTDSIGEIHWSARSPCSSNAATIASRTTGAQSSSHQANTVGPAPEMEQP